MSKAKETSEIVQKIFSISEEYSMKRILGFIGFIEVMVLVIFNPEYIPELLYVTAGLVGLTVLDKWAPGNRPNKEENNNSNKTIEEAENES